MAFGLGRQLRTQFHHAFADLLQLFSQSCMFCLPLGRRLRQIRLLAGEIADEQIEVTVSVP